MPGSQQGDGESESLQVRNYGTGGAACLHVSKATGNVWLPLTKGGDCSRWYLKEKGRRERYNLVFFFSPLYECLVHMTTQSTSELECAEAC